MKIYALYSVVGELRTADRRIDIVKIYDSYSLYPKLDEEEVLEGFFQMWAVSQEIKKDVLPEIDSVLSGEKNILNSVLRFLGWLISSTRTRSL
ncbi:hypothetical protein MJO52_06965 [Microbulbifer variabilis]|uniref:Uncharacterized protein n=1 Tax=Microbulbifer variabilis TaxID=266805 RepID=A0ABY4VFA2_9GAMM|nr:hypothetical protein [Microbulbifer variabilis]USD22874.1 hypothetical protein MJO52_06965 [Microbulbifer variabilis]